MLNSMIEGIFGERAHHVWRMMRVSAVGAVGFVIQTAIFEIIGIQLSLVSASTATLIGAECAILCNFFLNDRFSFRASGASEVRKWRRLLRFHLVVSGSLVTQWIFVRMAENFTDDAWMLRGAYVCGVGVGFFINYVGYYLFVWKEQRKKAQT